MARGRKTPPKNSTHADGAAGAERSKKTMLFGFAVLGSADSRRREGASRGERSGLRAGFGEGRRPLKGGGL